MTRFRYIYWWVAATVFMGAFCVELSAAEPQDSVFMSRLDGTEQRYVLVLPDGFDQKNRYSLMIVLHGHGSDRWQFVKEDRDECQAARDFARSHHLIYVSPDYRAKTSWMGPKAEADMVQIITELRERFLIDKIILGGGSMGGSSALIFASLHPQDIDGVFALNATANISEFPGFPESVADSYGGTKTEVPNEYRRRTVELFPERLTMPVAFTTGGQDTVVPPASVLRLAEKLRHLGGAILLIHRPDEGHRSNYADTTSALNFVVQQLAAPDIKDRP